MATKKAKKAAPPPPVAYLRVIPRGTHPGRPVKVSWSDLDAIHISGPEGTIDFPPLQGRSGSTMWSFGQSGDYEVTGLSGATTIPVRVHVR
jgi:hypothetical protein